MSEIFDNYLEQTPDEILSGFAEDTLYMHFRSSEPSAICANTSLQADAALTAG